MYREKTLIGAVLFGLAFTATLGFAPVSFGQSSPKATPQDDMLPEGQGDQGIKPPSPTGAPVVIKPPANGTMPVIKPPAAGTMPVIPPPTNERGKDGKPQQ